MPAEPRVFAAGQIVLADWRGDALPKEPNKRRPAIVVEDDALFAPSFPTVVLVPLTTDGAMVIPHLAFAIPPTSENGCNAPSWALSYLVSATSRERIHPTPSRITPAQLAGIRTQIALLVGVDP